MPLMTAGQRKKARQSMFGIRGGAWSPQARLLLRAWWKRDGMYETYPSDPAGDAAEAINVWRDAQGTYHADVIASAAPTAIASVGGPINAGFNGTTRSIGVAPTTLPADAAGTLAAIVRAPLNNSARDFDAIVAFTDHTTTTHQAMLNLRRLDASNMRASFTIGNAGGFSSWHGDTNLAANSYYRIVAVLTGSAMSLYVNGTLQTLTQTNSAGPTIGQWLSVVPCTSITLGGRRWSSGTAELWAAHFDQVLWFGEALDAGTLAWLDDYLATAQGEID